MANFNFYCIASIFSVLTIIKSGEGLRCWTCSSEEGGTCADYFNTTTYLRLSSYQNSYQNPNAPVMENCDNMMTSYPFNQNQKVVCMKEKKTNYGRVSYVRKCHSLQSGEQVGKCPQQTHPRDITVDFCEYCDWDGCNGANTITTNILWASILPIVLTVFLRK